MLISMAASRMRSNLVHTWAALCGFVVWMYLLVCFELGRECDLYDSET